MKKRSNMRYSCSLFSQIWRKLKTDSTWPLAYFSWIYLHYAGTDTISGVIFSTVVIVGHLACAIYLHVNVDLLKIENARTNVSTALLYWMRITQTLNIPFTVMAWCIWGQGRIRRVISTISDMDEKLLKFGQQPNKKSDDRKFFVLICVPILLMVMIFWYESSIGAVPDNDNVQKCLFIFTHYVTLVATYTPCFFACLVSILGDRYRAVNSLTKRVLQDYSFNVKNQRRVTFNSILAIRELRAVHRKLFFAAENISKAFGFQLLIIFIISLTTSIGDLYYFYTKSVLRIDSTAQPLAWEYLVWTSLHITPLCIASFCCSYTSAEAKNTAVILQEITVSGDDLYMEMSTFSLQLLHYELNFSVCGFYDIDLSFIRIVVGTIMTYLVILLQIGTMPQNLKTGPARGSDNFTNSSTSTLVNWVTPKY